MKMPLLVNIILLSISFSLTAQSKSVIFELKETEFNSIDSISFKSRKIMRYKNFVKIPKKRKVSIFLYKNGDRHRMSLQTVYLGKFNTIQKIEQAGDTSSYIKVLKGSTTSVFNQKKYDKNYSKIIIKVNQLFTEKGEFLPAQLGLIPP